MPRADNDSVRGDVGRGHGRVAYSIAGLKGSSDLITLSLPFWAHASFSVEVESHLVGCRGLFRSNVNGVVIFFVSNMNGSGPRAAGPERASAIMQLT
jgi:hypothetical protein